MKFFIFVAILLILMPSLELIGATINNLPLHDDGIAFYIVYILISTISSLMILIIFKKLKNKNEVNKNYFYFTDFEFLTVTAIGSLLFLYFINDSVSSFSLINLAVFSEEYRNGIYQGSGLYTLAFNHILPLMLSVNIAFGQKFRTFFFICLFISVLAILTMGLRIFLMPVIFALIYKISDDNTKIVKLLFISFLLLIFLGFFKVYLDMENIGEKNVLDYLLNPFTRLNYRAITYFKIGHGLNDFECMLPAFEFIEKCNSESFKYNFFSINPNISNDFLNLSKYSGIAMPLPLYMYNIFGFFAIPFTALFLITINFLYSNAKSEKINILKRILCFVVLTHFFGALFEDILQIRSLDVDISLLLIIFLLSTLCKKLKVIF